MSKRKAYFALEELLLKLQERERGHLLPPSEEEIGILRQLQEMSKAYFAIFYCGTDRAPDTYCIQDLELYPSLCAVKQAFAMYLNPKGTPPRCATTDMSMLCGCCMPYKNDNPDIFPYALSVGPHGGMVVSKL